MYDAIVIGLGAHGSAAAAELARRGARVLGLERFQHAHEMGSFVGRSRIIRLSYFEHPDYVPLLRRAWDRWLDLERETGERLLTPTGGLYAGPPGCETVAGALRSAQDHRLAHEVLDGDALRERFPWLRSEGMTGLLDQQAGYLVPERCIEAHLTVAERHGAELRFDDGAASWRADGSGFAVTTRGGETERGERLVLSAGAWLPSLLGGLRLPLEVERVPLFWFDPPRPDAFRDIPVYIVETDDGTFYGFPYLADQGLKVARHGTGEAVADPDRLDRAVRPDEDARVRRFVRRHMPDGDGPLREARICMYTRTPDEHFVVDCHPEHSGAAIASACSGHGFKFASVMGEILADLALDGATAHRIGFLSLGRLAAAPS